MRIAVRAGGPADTRGDLSVVAVGPVARQVPRSLTAFDRSTGGAFGRLLRTGDFTGQAGRTALLYPGGDAHRVLLVGLGDRGDVLGGSVRRAAAIGARLAIEAGAETVGFSVAPGARRGLSDEVFGQQAAEGAGQGGWAFESLRTTADTKGVIRSFTILCAESERIGAARGSRRGAAVGAGQSVARDLQMLPGNLCTPSHLASVARQLGRKHGFKVSVMRRAQIEKEGMNALLAVAQGSAEEPRFITMEYRGGKATAPPICLVGKGVTFDSGGISIKPALSMEEMKFDMSGAAAVLGAFDALGRLKPRLNVVGLIPTTENLPSGTAIKPGDVVTTHLGKTVEIINTDAEGRLILCDALSYARKFKPACIVDAATLTGAIVIGLGTHATGVMGNDDRLIEELRQAGERGDERCWPMPLWDVYRPLIKSDTADIKNTGGRAAGSITAGWFLREFVEDSTPWAHLDIAGTAYIDAPRPGLAKGPTGVGVRLFIEFLLARAAA